MKTKDLIAMLLQCDPESEPYFNMSEGCCGDDRQLFEIDADFMGPYKLNDELPTLRITFAPVPGYKSCRQVGATLDADKKYWERFGK